MDIVRQSLALVFVFGLLGAALWFVRNRGWAVSRRAKPASCILESRGKLILSARHSIHVVRVANRDVILALYPDGVTLLGHVQEGTACGPQEMAAK